ncbi:MAG: diguanylate cyclase [Epsilonproteobacteria bacterium]|nr:diguanylate cyclase [Campylobacterota bacterium]
MRNEAMEINFTKRYALALMLIALLSTGAYYILAFALKTSDYTALIVNKSAKQRMYSQRIASFSQQYYRSTYVKENNFERKTIQLTLEEAINEMRQANNALSSGNINQEVNVKLSTAMADMYFGDTNLKKRVDDYLDLAKQLTKAKTQEEALHILDHLLLLSNPLLVDINTAVLQYQKEGEENIANIRYLESLAWIATLFALLMEVIFIFQPMANMIKLFIQNEKSHSERLEQEIKIRTYSLEQANQKLIYNASHDPLTGLNNRFNFERELGNILSNYHLNNVPFSVLMLDIDWFKKINDTYGHQVGDHVLKELSTLLSEAIRTEDSAYRTGGEEFVIILNRISKLDAIKKAEEIRHSVENYTFSCDGYIFNITISCGVYHSQCIEAQDVHEVMKLVDDALYKAKHLGRNRIVLGELYIPTVL